MTEELKKTALNQWHVDHGGRMVPFAGYDMPVQYPTGPMVEHEATRNDAGLFDIDHMGQVEFRGPDAEKVLNKLVSYDIRLLKDYESHYAIMCYEDGTAIDDVFVYKLPDEKGGSYYFVAINAANRAKDIAWIKSHLEGANVEFKDISDETYMMAFQGPKAPEILNRISSVDLTDVPRFYAVWTTLLGDVKVLLGRTGYTGEDGFEVYAPADQALKVWDGILKEGEKDGAKPIGLAARDSLRFEACMPLYGHELHSGVTPVESGLGFAISYDKDFIGRNALLKQKLEKPAKSLVAFELTEKGLPREHYPVVKDGQEVGIVTSGMLSPTTKRFVGMAFVPRELAARDSEIEILIRNKPVKAKVVKKPFYTPAYRRQESKK